MLTDMNRLIALLMISALPTPAVATPASTIVKAPAKSRVRNATPELSFRGVYTLGFERSEFVPCRGAKDRWWVTGAPTPVQGRPDLFAPYRKPGVLGFTVYVEWRGKASAKGRYGHMGAYSREMNVTQVRAVSGVVPADCRG